MNSKQKWLGNPDSSPSSPFHRPGSTDPEKRGSHPRLRNGFPTGQEKKQNHVCVCPGLIPLSSLWNSWCAKELRPKGITADLSLWRPPDCVLCIIPGQRPSWKEGQKEGREGGRNLNWEVPRCHGKTTGFPRQNLIRGSSAHWLGDLQGNFTSRAFMSSSQSNSTPWL